VAVARIERLVCVLDGLILRKVFVVMEVWWVCWC